MTETNTTTFKDLNLIPPLLEALHTEGYEHPTPVQQQAIPHILSGRDLLGCAQTGTGKTAAFALPILQILADHPSASTQRRPIRTLVLTPTRELAAQIGESFNRYGAGLNINSAVIFGGVAQGAQASALRRGVDVLIATPGRLLDLVEQRLVDLTQLEIFVLDEADRMLDMGFIHDVRRVIKIIPQKRHSLFFSATMPRDIQKLAHDILTDPVKVEVTPVATTAEKIDQSVFFVESPQKRRLLESLMLDPTIARALVFSRTKHGADRIARFLNQASIPTEAIHGNKSQNNRVRALNNFKEGKIRVLVATDIAARGIDIEGVTHVINYELPNVPESYVHRIGRTARAGAEGIALSFCDTEERAYLKDIEKLIRQSIPVVPHALTGDTSPDPRPHDTRPPRPQHSRSGGRGRRPQAGGGRRPDSSAGQTGHAGHRSAPSARHASPSRPATAPAGGRNRPAHRNDPRRNDSPRGAGARGPRSSGGGRNHSAPRPASTGAPRTSAAPRAQETPVKKPWWKKLLPESD